VSNFSGEQDWFGFREELAQMLQSKHLKILVLSMALTGSSAMFALASQTDQSAKQDMKDAGNSTKNAAKDTGSATKKTAKKTGHAVKKATNKSAKKTKEGAQKVEDKTQPK
jgi:hypothetical protein